MSYDDDFSWLAKDLTRVYDYQKIYTGITTRLASEGYPTNVQSIAHHRAMEATRHLDRLWQVRELYRGTEDGE